MEKTMSFLWFQCLLCSLILVVTWPIGGLAIQGLTRNFGPGCVEDGTTVSYTCTALDTNTILVTTAWEGTAFDCPSSNNIITLQHNFYNTTGASGSCTGGAVSAMSVGVDGNEYTSRLNLMASLNLNGTTIGCSLATQVPIGSDTLNVGVIPPAPGPIDIIFSNSGSPSFTVSWSPSSGPVVGGIGGYMFGVIGDCGDCMNMTVSADTLSVTCSGWTVNDQRCTFGVRTLTQDCGFISDLVINSITLSAISISSLEASVACSDPSLPITLDWILSSGGQTDVPPASSIIISYSATSGDSNTITLPGWSTSYTLPNPTMNTVYTFTVTAVNGIGHSAPSTVIATTNVVTMDDSMVSTNSCVTVTINNQCVETTQQFRAVLRSGPCSSPLNESSIFTFGPSYSTCLELPLSTDTTCYSYTTSVFVGSIEIANQTGTTGFKHCLVSQVVALAGPGVSYSLGSIVSNNAVPHRTVAFFSCVGGTVFGLSGSPLATCVDGTWNTEDIRTCSRNFTPAEIATAVIITFISTLILCIIIGVVSVLLYNKYRRGTGQSSSAQPPTELKQVGAIYEEPEDFKPDPTTQGNVAYGHVQPLRQRQ